MLIVRTDQILVLGNHGFYLVGELASDEKSKFGVNFNEMGWDKPRAEESQNFFAPTNVNFSSKFLRMT